MEHKCTPHISCDNFSDYLQKFIRMCMWASNTIARNNKVVNDQTNLWNEIRGQSKAVVSRKPRFVHPGESIDIYLTEMQKLYIPFGSITEQYLPFCGQIMPTNFFEPLLGWMTSALARILAQARAMLKDNPSGVGETVDAVWPVPDVDEPEEKALK